MDDSDLQEVPNDAITKVIKVTLYNLESSEKQIGEIDKIQFVNPKRRPVMSSRNKEIQDTYLTSEFIPRLPIKHLVNQPKVLYSLQRKKLRLKHGMESRAKNTSTIPKESPRSTFRSQKCKIYKPPMTARCRHTSQSHTVREPLWMGVPPLFPTEKPQTPHFLFNMRHMIKEAKRDADNGFNVGSTKKGWATSYYGKRGNIYSQEGNQFGKLQITNGTIG